MAARAELVENLFGRDELLLFNPVHFAAGEDEPGDFSRRLASPAPFPISGYTTSVDWGGSAILEFTYLDMILSKALAPAEAAAHLVNLIAFAGDGPAPGSPYAPAGFHFIPPEPATGTLAEPPPVFLA